MLELKQLLKDLGLPSILIVAITAVNTGAQTITATVTAAFPDGTAHVSQQWYVGAASKSPI